MNDLQFSSTLAGDMLHFVDLRRLSGSDYYSQTLLLTYFDRFLKRQGWCSKMLTCDLIDAYEQTLATLAPRSRDNRMCVVGQLCKYLARSNPLHFIPERRRLTSSSETCRPYIYTVEQIGLLMRTASSLAPQDSLRPHTHRTLLGLLYSTGIRIGEAMALNLGDFDFEQQQLHVVEGKFRKSRCLVLSDSTALAVQAYLNRRLPFAASALDAPLFVNERRRRLRYSTVHSTYRRLLRDCKIGEGEQRLPRLHDLRHSFAVRCLLQWYSTGQDVNALLPVLATYMGHVQISSTRVYLQPTAELFAQVSERFHLHYQQHVTSQEV
jgi:site-specific recombinase XerD